VLETAVQFMATAQGAEDKSIEKYITTMDGVLSAEQKKKFVAAYQAYMQKNATKGRGTPAVPPTGNRANTPANRGTPPATNRGSGTSLPGRGTTQPGRGSATTVR
jgi:hypothetical protein